LLCEGFLSLGTGVEKKGAGMAYVIWLWLPCEDRPKVSQLESEVSAQMHHLLRPKVTKRKRNSFGFLFYEWLKKKLRAELHREKNCKCMTRKKSVFSDQW